MGQSRLPRTVRFECREVFVQDQVTDATAKISFRVHGSEVCCSVDTGAQVTIMSEEFFHSLSLKPALAEKINLRMAGSQVMCGRVAKRVEMVFQGEVFFWDVIVASIQDPFLLGLDFLNRYGAVLDFSKGTFRLKGKTEYIKLVKNGQEDEPYEVSRVWVKRKLVVPPNTTVNVKVSTSLTSGEDFAVSSSNHNKGLLILASPAWI